MNIGGLIMLLPCIICGFDTSQSYETLHGKDQPVCSACIINGRILVRKGSRQEIKSAQQ